MYEYNMYQAINQALEISLREDPRILIFGQDVGVNGGVFRVTDNLYSEFGERRVFDTPLSESAIVGTAIGMAANGLKPIIEIQFMGFLYSAFEQIISHAARIRYRSKDRFTASIVIRAPYGGGIGAPEIHSDSSEAFFVHQPGLKVVVPSNPYDAKGLLISAIKDPDPVLFLEPLKLYRYNKDQVPESSYEIPLGKGSRLKTGSDITLIAWGGMVPITLNAAKTVKEKNNINCDVIDLRTLSPLDNELIINSFEKTGRCVIVHEAPKSCSVSSEIISLLTEEAFYFMEAPISRVTGHDVPYPFYGLEKQYLPSEDRIINEIIKVINH